MPRFQTDRDEPYRTAWVDVLKACVVRPVRILYVSLPGRLQQAVATVPWHTLAYATAGEATYVFPNGDYRDRREVVFRQGDLLWLPKGSCRGLVTGPSGCTHYSYQLAVVGDLPLSAYGLPEWLWHRPCIVPLGDHGYTSGLFARLWLSWQRRDPASLLLMQGLTLEALALLSRVLDGDSVAPHLRLRIQELIEYMATHLADPELDLGRLAAVCGWSPRYLIRVFRLVTGKAPMAYLRELRVNRAVHLLGQPGLSVHQIGAAVGYPDPAHFSRVFKGITGVAPQAYRAELKALDHNDRASPTHGTNSHADSHVSQVDEH